MTIDHASNDEVTARVERAADLISQSLPNKDVVKKLVKEFKLTPQQCRDYARRGRKLFLHTQYDGDQEETAADAIQTEYFIIQNDLKADRIDAREKGDWAAVASLNRTRLKHIEMSQTVMPLSITEKDLRDHMNNLMVELVKENFKNPKGKIPRESISKNVDYSIPKVSEKELEDWKIAHPKEHFDQVSGHPLDDDNLCDERGRPL